ncbi:hypothetical protein SAMN02745945_02710 [Peptoclostridium litorale DSM 5388]|uniref:Uncharacterized protein n=1 Tax=Peptoclostridium litorale DSM 5388 TaxID=1121324 RepID=A0A069RCY4_PEPLI|nr:hypothetical protein [Peptoclostridium litorale]KDR94598.1 hypothetical protein CLIT_14c00590 [Peptoclostridium litorale DSM 5388]SIO31926.1 hypothetical protein SAMN02745945_02710 [Peptoclostridium litorale DSM 5388]
MERSAGASYPGIIFKNKYTAGIIVVLASAFMSYMGAMHTLLAIGLMGAGALALAMKQPRLAIVGIIFMLENMVFLIVPQTGFKTRLYVDAALIIIFAMGANWMIGKLKNEGREDMDGGVFSKYVLAMFALVAMAAVNSMRIYSQPIELGLRASRAFLIFASYFPLREIMREEKARKWAKGAIMYGGFVLCIMYFAQYFLMDRVQILGIEYIERFGQTRLRIEIGLIVMSFFISLSQMAQSREHSFKFLSMAVLEIAMLTVMIKTRTVLLGLVISAGVFWFLQKRYSRLWIIYFAAMILFVNGIYMQESIASSMYKLTVDEISSKAGNYDVRLDEMKFYMNQALENPVIGRGVLNELHPQSNSAIGTRHKFYLSDIGVFAFFFYFGGVGIIWVALFLFSMARISIRAVRESGSYMLLLLTLYIVITMPTIFVFESPNMTFYTILAICMSEGILENKRDVKIGQA